MTKKTYPKKLSDPTFDTWARSAEPGERIRWLLEMSKMKQTELAGKMDISQAAISNWITGHSRKPNSLSLVRLADAMGSNEPWIMYGKGNPLGPTTPAVMAKDRKVQKTIKEQNASRDDAEEVVKKTAVTESGDVSDSSGNIEFPPEATEDRIHGGMERRLISAYRAMHPDAKLAFLAVADALVDRR